MYAKNFKRLTLRDLAAPLFRRQRVLIISFLCVFATGALLGLLQWHKYESHMAILISHARLDPIVTTDAETPAAAAPVLTPQEFSYEAELLQSRDLLEQVVFANGMQNADRAFLDLLHPRQTQADRVARAVRGLASQIEVENPANTNLIEVSYRSPDPAEAYGVLNSLGKLYLDKHAVVHRPPAGSKHVLSEQAQDDKAALADAEAGLRAFGQTHGDSPDPAMQSMATAAEQPIPTKPEQGNVAPPGSATKQDAEAAHLLLENLATSLLAAEAKRTQLLQKYEPGHPLLKAANQQVNAVKDAIAEANKAQDEADLADQRATLAANQRGVETLKAQMAKQGSQSLDEADVEREAKADERKYLQYLSSREQARTTDLYQNNGNGTRIENVAIATPPAIPVLPAHGRGLILLLAFAFASLVSFVTAFVIDCFDPSFHSPAQVIDILGIPVVIAVPKRIA